MIRHCETRKRKKKTEDYLHHLPDDLLIHCILNRLPLPCLFRCTAVCKPWRRLVKEAHALYGGTTMAKQALSLGYGDIRVITPTGTASDGHNNNEASIDISRHYSGDWSLWDSNNGLLLYMHLCWINKGRRSYNFHVCNPFTSKSVPLPIMFRWSSGRLIQHFSMLVFDPAVSHHYKVITNFGWSFIEGARTWKVYDNVWVFSSEQAHLGWRRLEGGFSVLPNDLILHSFDRSADETVCLNGYAYRLGFRRAKDDSGNYYTVVFRLNVKEESSHDLFDCPPALHVPAISNDWSALGKAQGYLQYIHNDLKNVRIWRLQEDGRGWALRHKIRPSDDNMRHYPARDACVLLFYNNDEVLHFIGRDKLLYLYNIDQQKLECYLGSDGRPMIGDRKSLRPFLCCAIDPEFRRFSLRPRK